MKLISPIGNRGFTFIEALVTVLIFSIGFLQLFLVFFKSASVVAYTSNRLYSLEVSENAVWETKQLIRERGGVETLRYENEILRDGLRFNVIVETSKKKGFTGLYRFDTQVLWQDRERSIIKSSEKMARV
jgi:prepilin-type N-terminal cleavage/methylation domain-containing protein